MSVVEALYGGSPSTEKSGAVARGAAKDDEASSKEHRKTLLSIDAMVIIHLCCPARRRRSIKTEERAYFTV